MMKDFTLTAMTALAMAGSAHAAGQDEPRADVQTPKPRIAQPQPLGTNNPFAAPGVVHRGGEVIHNTGQVIHRGGEVMHHTPVIKQTPRATQKPTPTTRKEED